MCPEVPVYEQFQQRAGAFYQIFDRKSNDQHQTHYCPGCGHGITHKLIARAIDELGVQDRTILVSPGRLLRLRVLLLRCRQHPGRPRPGIRRSRRSQARPPGEHRLSYQGDGDLAAIGSAEILHAANRGEPITVFFLNNAIYGMTGGQMAPTTLVGQKSTTTPYGRNVWNEGYPLHVCELLASLEAPVYLERVGSAAISRSSERPKPSSAPSTTRSAGSVSPWSRCCPPVPPSGR
jgi:2-oxoisovalerate ferredoxin oxidoreductase beta subunit